MAMRTVPPGYWHQARRELDRMLCEFDRRHMDRVRARLPDGSVIEALTDFSKWKGVYLVPEHKGTPRFHPMPGKIVVEPFTEDQVGGLWLPNDKSRVMGTVIAVGGDEDDEGDDYDVKVGDVVLFHQNSGVKVKVDRVEVLFFRTSEILCTVTWEEEDA